MAKTGLKWTGMVLALLVSFVAGVTIGGYWVEQWYLDQRYGPKLDVRF